MCNVINTQTINYQVYKINDQVYDACSLCQLEEVLACHCTPIIVLTVGDVYKGSNLEEHIINTILYIIFMDRNLGDFLLSLKHEHPIFNIINAYKGP